MRALGQINSGRALTATAIALITTSGSVSASGFALPELSIAGLGLANAIVANPVEPGAIPYNPAAIGFHDKSALDAGALFINPHFKVKTASGTHDSEGADWVVAPLVQGVWKIDDRWGLGLGVNAPFGLETDWKVGTFPIIPLQHPTRSKLEIVSLVPTLSYRVNESLSLAGGADYYRARTGILNTGMSDIEGDGDAWGWNASALFRQGPWSFGVSFHSAATANLSGDFKVSPPLPPALNQDVTLDLDLPWRLQVGVRYAVNDDLAVELDLTRTGWSEFKQIQVISESNGRPITTDTNDWNDANAFRFGLTYRIQPGTQLRLGYSYDKTGQPDDHFSARVPDSDRHLFGIGVGHEYGNGWSLEAGYMYVLFDDRKYRSSKPYIPGQDVNGTIALNGDYDAHANLLGLSVRKKF